ncbi:hypothetical protein SAMN05660297_03620 [Natronincola peptidivorans]|uniref:Cof subfamily of IIB subfamily of haloacid dehalogenase superfamily/HAD-superfamily hydrolase, subfamily IIB n=1 Tax=Natronincola peptidivorans TaxID=426128 RepID=A0A1I0HH89_9FIRM|nr:Cof-type HAD-IIB family hydrolase [Natronincola peptidivorans]SET82370.1 hypothetical protein SAMN05660297_03620 [Natronincola peptidivorans]
MNYKLLATDMDGTLLMDNKSLSQQNIDALRRVKEKDIEIAICTGRPYNSVEPYLRQLNFDCWVITSNGSVIRDKEGKIISVIYMKSEALKKAIEILEEEKIYYHISDEKYTYIRNQLQRVKFLRKVIFQTSATYWKAWFLSLWIVLFDKNYKKVDFSTFTRNNRNATNIFIYSEDTKQLQAIKEKLEKIKGVDVTSSGQNNIEVLDNDATKGKSLEGLAKLLNITKKEIIAVGDNFNDLSMIQYAGLGVAMKNAEKEVLENADWITKTNEEHGIDYLVRKIIEVPKKSMEI